jgi:hypothetical protein
MAQESDGGRGPTKVTQGAPDLADTFADTIARMLGDGEQSSRLLEEAGRLMIAEARFLRWVATVSKERVWCDDRDKAIAGYDEAVAELASLYESVRGSGITELHRAMLPRFQAYAELVLRLETEAPVSPDDMVELIPRG